MSNLNEIEVEYQEIYFCNDPEEELEDESEEDGIVGSRPDDRD